MLWTWPLRSPARFAVTVVVLVAVAAGVGAGVGALSGGDGADRAAGPASSGPSARSDPRSTAPGGSSGTPAPTALPPVPDLEPTPLPLSQAPAGALSVAARWAGAWVRPAAGTTAQQWLDGLRGTTTDEYLGVLSAVDPANIPATRVTGEPRPVQVAAHSVQVEVPTDALTLVVLVTDTETGWRVAGYDRT
jgi:hypothetical protein